MLSGKPSTSYAGTPVWPACAPPRCPARAPAWPLAAPKRARHAAVTAEMHHEATISRRRRDRPQPRASGRGGAALLPAQAQALPACDEARELQLAAEVDRLEAKYAVAVQVNKDLGREQWEALKRAKELQRALDAAAAAAELAFLKGRLEGLAAVVAGVVEERATAAQTRARAEAAEASMSSLQVQVGSLRRAQGAAEAECGALRALVASLEERLSAADAQITRLSALALGAASLPAHRREGLEALAAPQTRNERVSSAVSLRRSESSSHVCV